MDKFISVTSGSAYGGKNKNGFSLIELIIVIAIISIMTVIGLISIQSGKIKTQLEASAREMAATVREAQNDALSGKRVDNDDYPCEYSLKQIDSSSYKIEYSYRIADPFSSNYLCSATALTRVISTYSLKNGVTISSFPSTLSFSVPFGKITTNGNSIQLEKNGTNYYVCLGEGGNISEKISC